MLRFIHWLTGLIFGPHYPHVMNLENGSGYTDGKAKKVCDYLKKLDCSDERRTYLRGQIEFAYMKGNKEAIAIGVGGARMLNDIEPSDENHELWVEALEFQRKYG